MSLGLWKPCVATLLTLVTAAANPISTPAPTPGHAHAPGPVVTVYKDPACGCCRKWVALLAARGFQVDTVGVPDPDALAGIARDHGVTTRLKACHTAVVGGYVFEGHVPVELVQRVLKERPAIIGLAVPGMPSTAPGMDMPTGEHYDVLAIHKDGTTTVYASR